jgi:hypothetical protein
MHNIDSTVKFAAMQINVSYESASYLIVVSRRHDPT